MGCYRSFCSVARTGGRIAPLDMGKAGLEACVRISHEHRPGRRMQKLCSYSTTSA